MDFSGGHYWTPIHNIYYPPFGYWFASWVAAPGVEPSTLLPYDKTGIDAASWDAMRAFRSPFVTGHYWTFYALLFLIVIHIVGVVVTELREGGASSPPCSRGGKSLIRNQRTMFEHVRCWHFADIDTDPVHVPLLGGKRTSMMAPPLCPQQCNTATVLLASNGQKACPPIAIAGPQGVPWGKHTAASDAVSTRLSGPQALTSGRLARSRAGSNDRN